jgi:tetratricopeptide (TPR) repeat protein
MRPRDRLTAIVLAAGVVHALALAIGPVAAQQPTGTPAEQSRDQDQRQLSDCDTSRDAARTIRACSAVLDRRGANAPTSATRIFALHKRANAYRERAEYAPAIADYSAVIALDAKDANAHYNRANIHLLRNDQTAAIADYRKAVELRPGLGLAHIQLGTLLLARGEARTALDHYDQAVRIDGRDTSALIGRGVARERLGDLDGAIASLSEAVTQSPDTVALLLMRAQLLRRKGENARALTDLDRALELSRDNIDALIERGTVHNALDNRDLAIADCSRAIAASSTNAGGYVCRGLARAGKGELRAARDDLDRAVQLDATRAETMVARGYVLYQLGALDAAIADFRQTLVLDATSADAQRFLGVALLDKGDTAAGMRAFDEALRAAPNDPWPHMLRAVGAAASGNREAALRDVATAIRLLGDSNSNARLARGVVYYHLGDLDPARTDIEAAIRLDAKNGQAHNALGRVLLRQRDFVRAGEQFDTAARLLPGSWGVLRNRALAAIERNDVAAARRDIAASLDITTAFAESFYVRGRVNEAEGQRNAAIADYEQAQTKLSLDGDGRRAQQQARDRIAALRGAATTPPASPFGDLVAPIPGPTSISPPAGAPSTPATPPVATPTPPPAVSPGTTPGAPPAPTATANYDSLRCRLLRDWARHAEGYSGVKLLEFDPGCRPK